MLFGAHYIYGWYCNVWLHSEHTVKLSFTFPSSGLVDGMKTLKVENERLKDLAKSMVWKLQRLERKVRAVEKHQKKM